MRKRKFTLFVATIAALLCSITANAQTYADWVSTMTDTRWNDQFTSWEVLFDGNANTIFHSEYKSGGNSIDGEHHYLRVDVGEPISLRIEGTSGIENSEISNQNSAFIYDLQGRRVAQPGKGVYIVNGKKVVL